MLLKAVLEVGREQGSTLKQPQLLPAILREGKQLHYPNFYPMLI